MSDGQRPRVAAQVRDLASLYRDDTAVALSRTILIPSLSGDEEKVIREIDAIAHEFGLHDTRIDGLGNLILRVGRGPRVLAIDAHVDTVDTGDLSQWEFDPFCGTVQSESVLGRGSVDQEGGAASMLTGARILTELGYEGEYSIYFTFTVMEEDCDGLCWNYLIENQGLRPDFAVITEPTNLGVYRGHRGRMEMSVRFSGVSAHGSAPHRGVNAIYSGARAALGVEELNARLQPDPFLGPGTAVVSRVRSSAPSLCAVPDGAELYIDRRLTWGETRETSVAEIDAIAVPAWRSVAGNDAPDSLKPVVSVPRYDKPGYTGATHPQDAYFPTWKIEEDHPLVQAGLRTAELATDAPATVGKWTFSTNGVALCGKHGIPTIGFGPGNEIFAHAPNEKTPIQHLEIASAFYGLLPTLLEDI
ncbi:MAG: YgeY family selenium metabolism-linked hydrolase [Spirochaetales bacterium]|nr:MAG: YgeY family selenium metabolism-linked hydrolase [Spirochaetales bacterium]